MGFKERYFSQLRLTAIVFSLIPPTGKTYEKEKNKQIKQLLARENPQKNLSLPIKTVFSITRSSGITGAWPTWPFQPVSCRTVPKPTMIFIYFEDNWGIILNIF